MLGTELIIALSIIISSGFITLMIWTFVPDKKELYGYAPRGKNRVPRFLVAPSPSKRKKIPQYSNDQKKQSFMFTKLVNTTQEMEKNESLSNIKIHSTHLPIPWDIYANRIGDYREKISKLEQTSSPSFINENPWPSIQYRLHKLEETIQTLHKISPPSSPLQSPEQENLSAHINYLESLSTSIHTKTEENQPPNFSNLIALPEEAPSPNHIVQQTPIETQPFSAVPEKQVIQETENFKLHLKEELNHLTNEKEEKISTLQTLKDTFDAWEVESLERDTLEEKTAEKTLSSLDNRKKSLSTRLEDIQQEITNRAQALQSEHETIENEIANGEAEHLSLIQQQTAQHQETVQKLNQQSKDIENQLSQEREKMETDLARTDLEIRELEENFRNQQQARETAQETKRKEWAEKQNEFESQARELEIQLELPEESRKIKELEKRKNNKIDELQRRQVDWQKTLESLKISLSDEITVHQNEIQNGPQKRLAQEKIENQNKINEKQSSLVYLRETIKIWEQKQTEENDELRISHERSQLEFEGKKNQIIAQIHVKKEEAHKKQESVQIEISVLNEAYAQRQKDFTERVQHIGKKYQEDLSQLRHKGEELESQIRKGRENISFEIGSIKQETQKIFEDHKLQQQKNNQEKESQRQEWDSEQTTINSTIKSLENQLQINPYAEEIEKLENQKSELLINFREKQAYWKMEFDSLEKSFLENIERQKNRINHLEETLTGKIQELDTHRENALRQKQNLQRRIEQEEKELEKRWQDEASQWKGNLHLQKLEQRNLELLSKSQHQEQRSKKDALILSINTLQSEIETRTAQAKNEFSLQRKACQKEELAEWEKAEALEHNLKELQRRSEDELYHYDQELRKVEAKLKHIHQRFERKRKERHEVVLNEKERLSEETRRLGWTMSEEKQMAAYTIGHLEKEEAALKQAQTSLNEQIDSELRKHQKEMSIFQSNLKQREKEIRNTIEQFSDQARTLSTQLSHRTKTLNRKIDETACSLETLEGELRKEREEINYLQARIKHEVEQRTLDKKDSYLRRRHGAA